MSCGADLLHCSTTMELSMHAYIAFFSLFAGERGQLDQLVVLGYIMWENY